MKKVVKVLLAFDSFKDSLDAKAVGKAVSDGLIGSFGKENDFSFLNIPLSDGGEGFVKSLEPVLDEKDVNVCHFDITGPFPGEKHRCKFIIYRNEMAIMDLASTSGLEMVPIEKRNPYNTTTFGLGELINHVYIEKKIKKILLGVGGSSTNDAGFGALQAMGLQFLPELRENQILVGKDLLEIKSFKTHNQENKFSKLIKDLDIDIACDVGNPFCGELGAAMVYGRQKGMTREQQKEMDHSMENLQKSMAEFTGRDISKLPGSGAAGGISGGFVAFQDSKLRPGIELFCEYVSLEEKIKDCDVIFSGEGKYDVQTSHGKAVSFVEFLSKKYNKPIVIICGKNEIPERKNVFDLVSLFSFEESMENTSDCLKKLVLKYSSQFPFFNEK